MINKFCNKCKVLLPIEQFHNLTSAPDGKQYSCIECSKLWRKNNHEKINAYTREYRKRPHVLEKDRKATIDWHKANPEKRKIHKQTYNKKHPEIVREAGRIKMAKRRKNKPQFSRSEKLKKYGLSLEDYNNMLIKHGEVCAICKRKNANGRNLAVDHSHTTGLICGLLCAKCNIGLGYFADNIDYLNQAIVYLKNSIIT